MKQWYEMELFFKGSPTVIGQERGLERGFLIRPMFAFGQRIRISLRGGFIKNGLPI
jgi:hypothetical protein